MSNETSLTIVCDVVQVVEEQVEMDLAQLCSGCGASDTLVIELVAHGLLEPQGQDPASWRFGGPSLALTRRAQRLVQDLGVNAAGAAVAIELLLRIEQLERRARP